MTITPPRGVPVPDHVSSPPTEPEPSGTTPTPSTTLSPTPSPTRQFRMRRTNFARQPEATDWRQRGVCATTSDPDRWFSPMPADRHAAMRDCFACPVRPECLSWATGTDQRTGIWGGVDFEAIPRRKLRTGMTVSEVLAAAEGRSADQGDQTDDETDTPPGKGEAAPR